MSHRNRKFRLGPHIGGFLRALRFPPPAKFQREIVTNGRLMWDNVGGLWLDENVGCANESKMERERGKMKPDWKDRVMTITEHQN
jgi:hypothetical protein